MRGLLAPSENAKPVDSGLRVRCPQCGRLIDLGQTPALSDIRCDSCGTHFSIVDDKAAGESGGTLDRIGQFEILAKLGTGAFGTVWKARDTRLDRMVAVKIPRQRHLTGPELEKFLREARAAAQLRHPNIVSVFEVGREGDTIYIVCDYVEGVSLAEWLAGKRVSAREAARLCRKLASALEHAHGQGVIHRDIKPGNILLDAKGEPHLTDFGLARREAGEVTMTMDGQLLGTPAYMSPELARGEAHQADRRTDIYSLGVVLFQLLTGELPFRGNTRMLVHQVIHDDSPSPRKLNGQVPRDLETICLKCLEKEPGRRYESAQAVGEELDRFLNGEPIQARPLGRLGRTWRWCRRKPGFAAMTAAAVALLLTVTVVSTAAAVRIAVSRRTQERENYYALIGLAQSLVEQGQIDQAKEVLLKCPPRYRHWEWGHLLFRCHQDVLSIPAHTDAKFDSKRLASMILPFVQSIIFSHDGSQLASLSQNGVVRVWNTRDGNRVFALDDTNRSAVSVAYSPSFRQLATLFSDGALEVWDTAAWRKHWDIRFEAQKVEQLAYRPDGNRLALRGGNEVWVCDAATGAAVGRQRTEDPITSVAFVSGGSRLLVRTEREARFFDGDGKIDQGSLALPAISGGSLFVSPNADRFVAIGLSGIASLWFNSTARIDLGEIRGAQPSEVQRVFFSQDGRRFCSGGEASTARVWDAESGKELLAIPSRVYRAGFSSDGQRLVTIGSENVARVWDLERRSELLQLRGHAASIESAAFSPDSRLVATADLDGVVKLWSTGSGREVLRGPIWIWGLSVSPDGRRILAAPDERGYTIWDADCGRRVVTVEAKVQDVLASAFSTDGQRVITEGSDGLSRVWDAINGRLMFSFEGHTRFVISVAYAPSGKLIATAGHDGTARLWEVDTGRQIRCLEHRGNRVYHVAFSPDGRHLATASEQGLRVWDAESGHLLFEVATEFPGLFQALFNPDGERLVLIHLAEPVIRVCDARTGKVLAVWPSGLVTHAAFSGDGKRLVVAASGRQRTFGYSDASVQMWDFESGRQILTLKGHTEPLTGLVFATNCQRVVSSSLDLTVRQWEVFPWRESQYAGPLEDGLLSRVRRYADGYWRARLAAEAQAIDPILSRPENAALYPKRDARAAPAQLDLTDCYNSLLVAAFYPVGLVEEDDNGLRGLGCGLLEFGGVRFDVRGVVQLRRHTGQEEHMLRPWDRLPIRVAGIRLEQPIPVRRLHVLHGTAGPEKEGAEVARFVWHYDHGQEESPVLYGQDVRDWWWRPEQPDGSTLSRSRVVWTGSNPVASEKGCQLRLCLTTIENPRPQEVVQSFDYVSAMSESAPFLVALTVE